MTARTGPPLDVAVVPLPVAYRDVRAADLGLSLDLLAVDALATRTVRGAGWTVDLRVLGASHQVLVQDAGAPVRAETVACQVAGPLPPQHRDGAYAFRSTCRRLAGLDFGDAVDRMVADLAGDPLALCAAFPGDGHAVTALRARLEPGAATWRTWHTYPRHGEVVVTESRVER